MTDMQFGAFGAVSATLTRHHKQLSCLTLRVSHRAWIEPGEWLNTKPNSSPRGAIWCIWCGMEQFEDFFFLWRPLQGIKGIETVLLYQVVQVVSVSLNLNKMSKKIFTLLGIELGTRHRINRTCSVEYCAKNCAVNVIEGALFRMKVELFPGVPQCVNSGPSSYMFTGRLQVVGSECPGRGARPRIKTFDLKTRPRRFSCLYKSLF